MAVMTIMGVITGKPKTKDTSFGQLIKVPIRERNKYYSPYKKYPYYNYFTLIAYNERIIKRIAPLEENDIVSFVCDIIPKKKDSARRYDFVIMDMNVLQIDKGKNQRMDDEHADSFAKSCEVNDVDELREVIYGDGIIQDGENDIPFD